MQIGFDVGATKIESVVLKDNGEESLIEKRKRLSKRLYFYNQCILS